MSSYNTLPKDITVRSYYCKEKLVLLDVLARMDGAVAISRYARFRYSDELHLRCSPESNGNRNLCVIITSFELMYLVSQVRHAARKGRSWLVLDLPRWS
jgi:hypothetical protein